MVLLEMINDFPMFAAFSEQEKEDFVSIDHTLLGYKPNDVIIKEGDAFESLYLLLKGTILITRASAKQPMAELQPGQVFGEISFLSKKPRASSVVAKDTVLVLKMDGKFFANLSPELRDKIKNYLIELLTQRLDTMNAALLKIAQYARGSTLE